MPDLWRARAWVWAVLAMGWLAACGEDNESGGNDNVWTGVSGVVIAVIVVGLVLWGAKRAGRGRD